MSYTDFDILLKKYLSGNCTSEEEQIVFQWYRRLIDESRLQLSDAQKTQIEAKIWNRISDNNSLVQQARLYRKKKYIHRWSIAACVAVLATMSAVLFVKYEHSPGTSFRDWLLTSYVSIQNNDGKPYLIRLDDSSTVTLEANSTLTYPSDFEKRQYREVYLKGDALFDIRHDPTRRFIVRTDKGLVTEDLGTIFRIQQNKTDSICQVEVMSGKVSVYSEKQKRKQHSDSKTAPNTIVLMPNEVVAYNSNNRKLTTSLAKDPKPIREIDKKRNHSEFVFDEAPLSKVLAQLTDVYGITIVPDSSSMHPETCRFTGDISDQNLFSQLDIICEVLNAYYEINGTTISIKGKRPRNK
ncbi:MAG: FecR family protein [Chitinophagaceae bacterium]